VSKSVKVNAKNETQAKQKAKEETEKNVDGGAVNPVEWVDAYNNNVDFIDIIN